MTVIKIYSYLWILIPITAYLWWTIRAGMNFVQMVKEYGIFLFWHFSDKVDKYLASWLLVHGCLLAAGSLALFLINLVGF